uniref:Uncharacterized protein n=1 Tax=Globodera rostochiensis TaxID=31243 RepID=A0A914IH46_GLORO
MVSRGLLLCLFISNYYLIAAGAWPDWASLNPIDKVAKRVPEIGNKVAKTVNEGVDKIGNTTGLDVEMLHGLKPLTEPVEGVIVFVGEKITANDTAWACGPDYPPLLDKPSHKIGKDSGDVLCLGVVMSYCVTMNLAGDKDAPHLKWLKEQAMKSTSAAPTENATSGA